MKAKRNKLAVEEIGGDRQAMSPIVALLLYSAPEPLVALQAVDMDLLRHQVMVLDEELGRSVRTQSILRDYTKVEVDRLELMEFLETELLGWQDVIGASVEDLSRHRRIRPFVDECAEGLYRCLVQGRLEAFGLRTGERERSQIPREKWSKTRFKLDFYAAAAGEKPQHEYRNIEIKDVGFIELGRKSKTGPKTNVVPAAAKAMRDHGLNPENFASQIDLCTAIVLCIQKTGGRKYSADTLATNYKEIISKYNELNK